MSYSNWLWVEERGGIGAFYSGPAPSYSITASVDKTLKFVGSNFSFSATDTSENLSIDWEKFIEYDFGNNVKSSITADVGDSSFTFNHAYNSKYSNSNVVVKGYVRNVFGNNVITATSNSLSVSANPLPKIVFEGSPKTSAVLDFKDKTGSDLLYFPNSIVSADWDFGDGNTSSTTNLTEILQHTYVEVGSYTVTISVYDISGNVGTHTISINILEGGTCKTKENYIEICGPGMLGRYGECRKINLREYLPLYLRGGEAEQFLVLFEDFLNEMYPGLCGWQLSALNLPVTENYVMEEGVAQISSTYVLCGDTEVTTATNAEELQLHWPTNASYETSAQRISILEKVNRLTELHDPDLIDLEYIQFFAHNLGYNVNVSRDEIGDSHFGINEISQQCSATEIDRYIRFVVSNLPTWYKIKTTRNAIKVMLYSFGLIGDLIEYFTNNYYSQSNGGFWRLNTDDNLSVIPDDWFPTPHFAIWIDVEASTVSLSEDIQRRQKVIRAIESIRPINTVFDKLYGYLRREIHLTAAGFVRYTLYKCIESDGYSNRRPIDGWPT